MNIYLDIDGVILGTASSQEDIEAWLNYMLDNFLSIYWLTTHCRGGENQTKFWLSGKLPAELVERMSKHIQVTDWGVLKTDAIDFIKPFIWFDDNLMLSERQVLEQHSCLASHFAMNPRDSEMAKKALRLLKEIVLEQRHLG